MAFFSAVRAPRSVKARAAWLVYTCVGGRRERGGVRVGDEQLEELYRAQQQRFVGVLTPLLGSREAGRDAVQEGFARALERRGDFRGGSLRAWVWRIVLNGALDVRRRPLLAALDERTREVAAVDPARDPALVEALRALAPRRRLLVFLRYYADLSYAEIAAVCGIDEGTVAATLAAARRALSRALAEQEVSSR